MDRRTFKKVDGYTDIQTHRQINRNTEGQMDRQTGKQTCIHTC